MTPTAEQLAKASLGDAAAREALGAWCLDHAYDVAFILLGRIANREEIAEEIAGAASARALAHMSRLRPGSNFSAWLNVIIRNCVRDHYRQAEKALPRSIYRRWVHDFFAAYRAELEAAIAEAPASDPQGRLAMLQRVAADLNANTYQEFMQLRYAGAANEILGRVKEWLREFVGLDAVSLDVIDEEGAEAQLPGQNLTEHQFMQRELVAHVNAHLSRLKPICRRLLRWYYLEELKVPEIARLEDWSERTTYRQIERCATAFRSHLAGDDFINEFVGEQPSAGSHRSPALMARGGVRGSNCHGNAG